MGEIGKLLMAAGAALLIVGLLLTFGARIPLVGRLPGDLRFESGGVRVYFPLATSIILSILLTVIANYLLRR